jgi:DNA-binding CsgD family transcriptional regulator
MDESHFTPRQREVLEQLCTGKSNKLIARTLGMAEATVKLHLTEIFKTLGVKTRYQAVIKASEFQVTAFEPPKDLTDLEILEEFTDLAFTTGDDKWSQRVIKFGHAIDKRSKGN